MTVRLATAAAAITASTTASFAGLSVGVGLRVSRVEDGLPKVVLSVCKGAVSAVLHAEAGVTVSLVDAHARLVVAQVVPTLRVAGSAVQVRTSAREEKEKKSADIH